MAACARPKRGSEVSSGLEEVSGPQQWEEVFMRQQKTQRGQDVGESQCVCVFVCVLLVCVHLIVSVCV